MCQQVTAPLHLDADDGDRTDLRNAGVLCPALTPLGARESFSGKIKHYTKVVRKIKNVLP